jgi:hypothetical protein
VSVYSVNESGSKILIAETNKSEQERAQAEEMRINTKLETLTGHYYPLDGYDFGKSLDVKTPNLDDVAILNTYAMTMDGVSGPADIIEDTVIKNEFDGVEFVWNAATQAWLDWGIGNIVTAGNDHLGVVEGTADPGDGSKDGFVTVHPGGAMETLGFSEVEGRVGAVEGGLGENSAAIAAKQDKIAARAGTADQVLLSPTTAGGAPGTKPVADFQSTATASAAGLMSSTDKANLDSLVSLANDIDDALDLINGETA